MNERLTIPLFPLNTVLFPGGTLRLQIFEVRYLDMIAHCIVEDTPFGVVLLTQGSEIRKPDVLERFVQSGTLATVTHSVSDTPGLLRIVCRGGSRFEIRSSEQRTAGLWYAEVETVEDDRQVRIPSELRGASDALERVIVSLAGIAQDRWPLLPPFQLEDCGWVSNRWCDLLPLSNQQKHDMLTLDNPLIRLELMHDLLDEHGLITS
ncbi:MAG TPA: LON peptidase substrate-binding domain-containing protein [Telluria sp.]|nr:LON peptidase substrate-binding domain-containing protein [Telluria sp.]